MSNEHLYVPGTVPGAGMVNEGYSPCLSRAGHPGEMNAPAAFCSVLQRAGDRGGIGRGSQRSSPRKLFRGDNIQGWVWQGSKE